MAQAPGTAVGLTKEDQKKQVDAFFASLRTRAAFQEDKDAVSKLAGGLKLSRRGFYAVSEHQLAFFRNGMRALGQTMVKAKMNNKSPSDQEIIDSIFADHSFRRAYQELLGVMVATNASVVLLPTTPDHDVVKVFRVLLENPWRVIPREIKEEDFAMPNITIEFVGKMPEEDDSSEGEASANSQ